MVQSKHSYGCTLFQPQTSLTVFKSILFRFIDTTQGI